MSAPKQGTAPDRRLIVRCDGGDAIGAGHVGRCVPLALALAREGWEPEFAGRFDGLAAWLLERAGLPSTSAPGGVPAGVDPAAAAAVVDSYAIAPEELCALADTVPLATIADARRCERRGVWVDYHFDRAGEAPSKRVLAGPRFAPIDPAFAGAGAPGADVLRALITVGGSAAAQTLVRMVADALRTTFPGVRLLVASGAAVEGDDVERLPFPGTLLDVVSSIDLAVSAAGVTTYELAGAGVPMLLMPIADNQRRVAAAAERAGLALVAEPEPAAVAAALARLADPAVRARLAAAGRAAVDGAGARRAARELTKRWTLEC